VYIEKLGNIDLAAMRKITSDERLLQNLVVEYEKLADPRLPACSRKSGHLLETCCTIFDMKGVGISSAGQVYGYLQQASGVSQNYYPERLGRLYIINAPWGFSGVFSVVKKFLDPVTVAKIHVLGSGYEKELLSQVPKENLPKQYGGTCQCEGGCEFSDVGPCKTRAHKHVVKVWVLIHHYREGSAMDEDARMGEEGRQQHSRHRQPCGRGPACWCCSGYSAGDCWPHRGTGGSRSSLRLAQ